MSIEIKSDILAKELNQGIVPLGVPKAYQYDAALVEAARAAVNQGLDDVAEAGDTAVNSVKTQESTSTTNINTLGDKILAQMKHGYGYPFTAATAAAMTDTAKIYVYTGAETGYTNGNWYYWNGTAWVSGGVYNATALETDKTLTVSGAAADAEVVGDYVFTIANFLQSYKEYKGFIITGNPGKWYSIDTQSFGIIPVKAGDIVSVNKNKAQGRAYFTVLRSLQNYTIHGGTPDFATGFTHPSRENTVTIPDDGHYLYFAINYNYTGDETVYIMPSSIVINGYDCLNQLSNAGVKNIATMQYKKGRIRIADWSEGCYIQYIDGELKSNPDFAASDYIPIGNFKRIGLSCGLAQFAYYDVNKVFISGVMISSAVHNYEQYDIPQSACYVRLSSSLSWKNVVYYTLSNDEYPLGNEPILVSKIADSNEIPDFLTCRAGIEFAMQYYGKTVFIKTGVYNLLDEFATEIENSPTSQIGLGLGKGIHVIASCGAIINCLYEGDDNNVIQHLSPFYGQHVDGGFKLENVEIHSKNCRYCVHDEYEGNNYKINNIYINCKMYHTYDVTGTLENYYPQCIGGGTAKHSYVDIRGCYFYSSRANDLHEVVSYHNSQNPNSKSNINIADCYIADSGTVRVSHYGPSTLMSKCTINNCSLGFEPILRYETSDTTTPENFELLSYCNDIRQS